jgi:hypothetical protein
MPTNELDYTKGVEVSLTLSVANPAAAATTALTLPQGGSGFVVPAGYVAHPICLSATSNADLTAGTATFRVTDDTVINVNGPSPVLSDLVQRASAVARVGAAPIAAGHVVGVSVVTDAGYLPITADLDAVLLLKLLPVG